MILPDRGRERGQGQGRGRWDAVIRDVMMPVVV